MEEAQVIASESEDPDLLLEARHLLAMLDFDRLKALIDDNPKWEEDDTVKHEIRALYDSTVDQFLHPYLFFGTEQEAAARGLLFAARTHQLAGREAHLRDCIDDIRQLYPDTTPAKEANTLLPTNSTPDP